MKKEKQINLSSVVKNQDAKLKNILVKEFTTEMLSGKKRHWCPYWDFGAIDDTMPEFEACKCNLIGID